MDNICVCCGEPIPEGRQVCAKCEKVPCYGCTDRSCGCHDSCERYALYRKGQDAKLAVKEKAWRTRNDYIHFKNESFDKRNRELLKKGKKINSKFRRK